MIEKCPLFKDHFCSETQQRLLQHIQPLVIQPEDEFTIQLQSKTNHLCYIEEGEVNVGMI